MRLLVALAMCLTLRAQTPQINLTQIQGSGTPGTNAIPFVAGTPWRLLGQDVTHLFWDPVNYRINLQGALFLNLVGGGTQCITATNSGIIAGVMCNSILNPPITFTDISTPGSNPSAGQTAWYSKGGQLCALNPTGVETCTGTGGGGTFSQLGNGKLVLTSSTVITMDTGCSTSTPCPVRVGDTVYVFTSSATATISAGSATGYFYVDGSGTRTVAAGANTVVCSGCTTTSGTAFPAGVVQYGTWTSSVGTWTASGGYTAMAAPLGVKPNTAAGYGLIQSGNTLAIDTTIPAFVALTDGATVTWAIANSIVANADLTFTVHGGVRTLNLTGLVSGGSYVLKLKQDSTGGEGLTLGSGCTWLVAAGGGGAITPSTGANAVDVLAFTYEGLSSSCLANFSKGFN